MAGFIQQFNDLIKNVKEETGNSTEETPETCVSKVDHQRFHLWLLLPSSIMILVLAFTISRKNIYLSFCKGRPGVVFPMDILGKSHRFSYAAAWGAIAYLAADMVLNKQFAVRLEGKAYVTAANGLISMLVYGIGYFPLFAALALNSVTGDLIGTAYAWMLVVINLYKDAECNFSVNTRLVVLVRDLPNLLCLGYLALSLPVRTFQGLWNKNLKIISSSEMVSILNTSKEIESSPEAAHVKQLLRIPLPPLEQDETTRGKIKQVLSDVTGKMLYQRKPNFRYSARITSVMFVGLILIYKTTFEIMAMVIYVLRALEHQFVATLNSIGYVAKVTENAETAMLRDSVLFSYDLLKSGRVCFLVSMGIACIMGVVCILHMLTSYRTNLFHLYKGDNTHIPPRSSLSNESLMVGSMRYAGYQVGYIGWGLAIQFLILFILSSFVAVLVNLIQSGWYQWIIDFLLNIWPLVLLSVVISTAQTLLSKHVFLQERGALFAIDNRRVLFSFTFFMFFYNTFIGFLSCLLRIIKSIVIGAVFLSRLDNSALPRRFQMFDPGFAAYVGFIHVECAHTHPVMLMFLRMLMLDYRQRHAPIIDGQYTAISMDDNIDNKKKRKENGVNTRARTRWFLAYTLYNNPATRAYRKAHLNYMKEMHKRVAMVYNVNKSAMGKLVREMHKTVTPGGITSEHMASNLMKTSNSDFNPAKMNWATLISVQKFMTAFQKKSESNEAINREFAEQSESDDDLKEVSVEQPSVGYSKCKEGKDGEKAECKELIKTSKGLWQKAANMKTKDTTDEVQV